MVVVVVVVVLVVVGGEYYVFGVEVEYVLCGECGVEVD